MFLGKVKHADRIIFTSKHQSGNLQTSPQKKYKTPIHTHTCAGFYLLYYECGHKNKVSCESILRLYSPEADGKGRGQPLGAELVHFRTFPISAHLIRAGCPS